MTDKKELEEKFISLFSSDFVNLYSEIKDKLYINAFDLLNQETTTSHEDFVKLIFNSVNFEEPEELDENEDLEEQFETY